MCGTVLQEGEGGEQSGLAESCLVALPPCTSPVPSPSPQASWYPDSIQSVVAGRRQPSRSHHLSLCV